MPLLKIYIEPSDQVLVPYLIGVNSANFLLSEVDARGQCSWLTWRPASRSAKKYCTNDASCTTPTYQLVRTALNVAIK